MVGFLVVINKNGQEGSSYKINDNNIYKFGSGFDCHVRFNTKKKLNQNYCTLSSKNRLVQLKKISSFPVLVNNTKLSSSKILNTGDIIKIGPKSFKWTTNPEDSVENKSSPANTKILTSSLVGKRRSTEFVKKITRRSLRNSTSAWLSAWEETNGSLQPSLQDAAMCRRSLRNSTSSRLSTWKETNESLAPSSKDIQMEQYTISESSTNESSNTMLKKKTPKRKSNASKIRPENVAKKSTSKKASKIPRITGLQTKIKLEENESPRSARKARNILRSIDSPRKFSTTTFAVKINASSASTTEFKEILSDLKKENTEMSSDTLKIDNSLTELKENVSLVESEPETSRKMRKSIKEPTTPKLYISAVDLDLKENNTEPLRTSPRKTPKKLGTVLSPRKSVKESTPTLHILDSVPVLTDVKTPDTSMNKPLVISGIKAIKSANKRNASLEKSLDYLMLAKKRNISNVMNFDVSDIELQDGTTVEDSIIFQSSESKLQSPTKSNKIAKADTTNLVPLGTTQTMDYINVSGIKELVRTPKDLRNSSKSPGTRKSLRNLSTTDEPQLDSPEIRSITKNISYSTPKTQFVCDWSIVDLTTDTPKNNASFVQDRSVFETTENESLRRKSPKQNKSVSNSFVDSPKRNASLRAVTPKDLLTVGDIFDESSSVSEIFVDSPKHITTTINRSLRSMHGTPDVSINDQTFNKSLGRRSQTPKQNQTLFSNSEKNMTMSFRDRSLRSISGTPEQNLIASSTLCGSPNINTSNTSDKALRSILKTPKHISNIDLTVGRNSLTPKLNQTLPSNDTPDNHLSKAKNKSTPVNITGKTSGRKSKTPKENLIVSENNTPERNITTGKKSKQGTPDLSLSDQTFNKSLGRRSQTPTENLLASENNTLEPNITTGKKSKQGTPDLSINDQSFNKSLGRRSQTPTENLLASENNTPEPNITTGQKSKHSTPDVSLSDQTFNKSLGRKSQTPTENLLASENNTPEPNITSGKKSKHSTPDVSISDQSFNKSLGRRSQTPTVNLLVSENNTPERNITTGKKSKHSTPDVSLSDQTFNKSLGRRSQTPTENLLVSENNTPERNITTGKKSKQGTPDVSLSDQTFNKSLGRRSQTPTENLLVSENNTPECNITTGKKSKHGTPDVSISDQSFNKSLGRRSQTPKQNQTLSSDLKDSEKNVTMSFSDRSLRSISGTPENVSSSSQTIDISGRQTPEQNLIASGTFYGSSSNIGDRSLRSILKTSKHISFIDKKTLGRNSITLKQNQTLPIHLNDSPDNNVKNRSLRSLPATPVNITGQTLGNSTGRKSKTPKENLIVSDNNTPERNITTVKQYHQQQEPKNNLSDLRGVKRLLEPLKTPKSPKNDLTNIAGVKALLKTPARKQKEIEPENDLSNVAGVKNLLKTPGRKQKEMEPVNDLTNVAGVKNLLKTPKRKQKEIEPDNDLRNVFGVKRLMRSPEPKQNEPKNDLTNVAGVKHLLKSPERIQKETEPDNDLRNVFGVKQLMRSPRRKQNDPENDLTNVAGVKHLLKSPVRQQKETEPVNDLTNVAGVKNLLKTPERKRKETEPENDLRNVSGVEQLMRSPERKQEEPKNDTSLDDLFDKLTKNDESIMELENSPHRHVSKTYERKVKSMSGNSNDIDNSLKTRNSLRFVEKDTNVVDKWLEDVKKYHGILAGCSVNIGQEPVQDQLKTETRKRNLRSKKIEIDENYPNEIKPKPRTRGRPKIVDAVVDSPSTRTRRNNKKIAEGVTKEPLEPVQDEQIVEEEPIQKTTRGRLQKAASKKATQENELIENEIREESSELVQNKEIVEEPKQKTTRGRQRKAASKTTIQENEMTEESPESVQNKQMVEEAKQKTTRGRQRKAASNEKTQENEMTEESPEPVQNKQIVEEAKQKTTKGRPRKAASKKTTQENKEEETGEIVEEEPTQKTRKGRSQKGVSKKTQDDENEPEEIIEAPKPRIRRAKRGQKVDNETEEIAVNNSEPEKNTRSLRVKRQATAEETESPALKRTRKNIVKSDSPVVEEVMIVQKTTRTIRNLAKPVVFSETVEILEHTDLPQLDIESLGVKAKAGRKQKIKNDVVNKQKIVRFHESPVTVVKEVSSTEANNEPTTAVRRSARTRK